MLASRIALAWLLAAVLAACATQRTHAPPTPTTAAAPAPDAAHDPASAPGATPPGTPPPPADASPGARTGAPVAPLSPAGAPSTPSATDPAAPAARAPDGSAAAGGAPVDPYSAMLLRGGDGDGDGAVSSEEWSALRAALRPGADGTLDRAPVLGRALERLLDADRDGTCTGRDLERALQALDADGSGSLEPEELAPSPANTPPASTPPADAARGGGARGVGRIARDLGPVIVGLGADANGDGRLDRAEWLAATGGDAAATTEVPPERLAGWFALAAQRSHEGPQDFGPATLLLSLGSALDATHDGRFGSDDLARLFADADADGNGALSPEELGRRAGPNARTPWVEADAPPPAGPPLMPWQRSLADALALSQQTGKPLLVCANVDGESASETFAAGRYRDPAFVTLARGFVPVLASPDRHTPRDHDDRGRRIPDPKFGRVLDAELSGIEPALFARYFGGQRVAPRHIGVAPDGRILFDLYLLTDLGVVDRALAEHGRPEPPLPDPAAMDEAALLASPDAAARDLLEERFLQGDEATRARLAAAALDASRATQQPELLRLALRDPSRSVRAAAVAVLAERTLLAGADEELLAEGVNAAAGDPAASHALAAGLRRLAATLEGEPRARVLRTSRALSAAGARSTVVDVDAWTRALAADQGADPAEAPADERSAYERLGEMDEELARRPGDEALRLQLARTALEAGQELAASGSRDASTMFAEAQQAARRVTEAQPDNGGAWGVLTLVNERLEGNQTAGEAATRALPLLLRYGAGTPLAADVLDAFLRSRAREYDALPGAEDGAADPGAQATVLLADAGAACEVLALHPQSTEEQVRGALDTAAGLQLLPVQRRAVRSALASHPGAPSVHEFHRWQVLRDAGAQALAAAYEELAPEDSDSPIALWFAGRANLAAAERHVENRDLKAALAAYERSAARYRRSVELNPDFGNARDDAALALAGAARVWLERDALGEAARAVREAAAESAAAFENPDGLGVTPAETARQVLSALRRAGKDAEAAELLEALAEAGFTADASAPAADSAGN